HRSVGGEVGAIQCRGIGTPLARRDVVDDLRLHACPDLGGIAAVVVAAATLVLVGVAVRNASGLKRRSAHGLAPGLTLGLGFLGGLGSGRLLFGGSFFGRSLLFRCGLLGSGFFLGCFFRCGFLGSSLLSGRFFSSSFFRGSLLSSSLLSSSLLSSSLLS